MFKGVYTETLVRKGWHGLGVSLSQLRWNGLPMVDYIDPAGPAAATSICVGDILLEVNGVSASTSLETLRRELGNEKSAVFTLLRKEAHMAIDPVRLGYRLKAKGETLVKRETLAGRQEEPDANERSPNQGQGRTQGRAIETTWGMPLPTDHNEVHRIEALAKSEISSLSSRLPRNLPAPSEEQAADMTQAGSEGFRKVYTRVWARAWAQKSLSGSCPTSTVEELVDQLTLLRKTTAQGPGQQRIDELVNSLNSSLNSDWISSRDASLNSSLKRSGLEHTAAAATTIVAAGAAPPRRRRHDSCSCPAERHAASHAASKPPPQQKQSSRRRRPGSGKRFTLAWS